MSFANRTSRGLLAGLFGKTTGNVFGALATAPAIHVALSTTAPAEDGSNVTEPVGNGYARVVTAAGDWNDPTLADPSLIDNANSIDFATPTGPGWGTVTHFVLFDALTVGNVLDSGALGTSRLIAASDVVSFPAGDLNITLD